MKVQKFEQDRINELKKALVSSSEDEYYWQIIDFLSEKVNLRQPLNSLQKQLVASEVLDGEVNNGGFDQFYRNWQLEYIDDAIEGLKQFGSEAFIRLAQISKQVYLQDRDSYTDRRNPAFDELDEEYYALPSYQDKKVAFIKENLEIVIKDNK
ncbi:DUF4375 domain-containing protein [Rhodocytophaga aerolata]|uniref:DUF4375 domain-containing protein n=1 Tax=Rhodocytophaga aerolata TaxID=455078 RepID=A0ABT8RIL3_9BACT|nr:DUF4375 domain-containing protein [Rhodocytophaga aerolata]MDO1451956.1 DUF4375 domain-containing protein [Rhodocytophaga aerolata]